MKICDICWEHKKKVTEATRRVTLKGHTNYSMDICDGCNHGIPRPVESYKSFIRRLFPKRF